MKILYLVSTAFPIHCGYTIRTHGFIKALSRQIDVEVYTLEGKTNKLDNVSYNFLKKPHIQNLVKIIKNKKFTLIQACSNWKVAFIALVTSKIMKIPFIYEVRGFWELSGVANGYHLNQRSLDQDIKIMQKADHVVTLNKFMKNRIQQYQVKKIDIVPNSFDPELFTPVGFVGNKIGYIGSTNQYERLDLLIEATKGHQLTLILNKKPSNLILHSGVKIITGVKYPEIKKYYRDLDILCICRQHDLVCQLVSPLKLVEFMGMGKVVIASDIPPNRLLITHGVTGLLFKQNLRKQILDVLSSSALRYELAQNAQKYVMNNLTWDITAEKMIHIWKNNFK